MDAKKFMQLVEEKQKKVLAKKEAPLKWEQKLEAAAAKTKADAEVKERKSKFSKHKMSVSISDSDNWSDENSKRSEKYPKKQRKRKNRNSGERERRKDKRRLKGYSSSSDNDDSDSEKCRRKRHLVKKHISSCDKISDGNGRHDYKKRFSSASGESFSSIDEDDDPAIKKNHMRYHREHRKMHSSPTYSSTDEDGIRKGSHPKSHKHYSSTYSSSDEANKRKSHSHHSRRRHRSNSCDYSDSDGLKHIRTRMSVEDNVETGKIDSNGHQPSESQQAVNPTGKYTANDL